MWCDVNSICFLRNKKLRCLIKYKKREKRRLYVDEEATIHIDGMNDEAAMATTKRTKWKKKEKKGKVTGVNKRGLYITSHIQQTDRHIHTIQQREKKEFFLLTREGFFKQKGRWDSAGGIT